MTQKDLFPEDPISSQPDILANPSQSLAEEKARKTTDISGQKFFPLFNPEDRLGQFSRMFVGTSLWVSTRCSLTWKEKATPQGRSLFQLSVSMHRTKGTESGSSPTFLTPNAMDSLPPRSPEALKKQYDKNRKGRDTHSTLREQVIYPKPSSLWPTPRATSRIAYAETPTKSQIEGTHGWNLNAAVTDSLSPEPHRLWPTPRANKVHPVITEENREKLANRNKSNLEEVVAGRMWPTPRASEYKDCGPVGSKSHTHMKDRRYLCALAKGQGKVYGQLNPTWVEWLMGYPEGWTELKD